MMRGSGIGPLLSMVLAWWVIANVASRRKRPCSRKVANEAPNARFARRSADPNIGVAASQPEATTAPPGKRGSVLGAVMCVETRPAYVWPSLFDSTLRKRGRYRRELLRHN